MFLKGEIIFHNCNLKRFILLDLLLVSEKVVDKVDIDEELVFLMFLDELDA